MNGKRFVQRLLVYMCPYETGNGKVTTVNGLWERLFVREEFGFLEKSLKCSS
jgi:hypothetical protein